MIEYITGGGGGLRGLAYIGALEFLTEKLLLNIKEYSATSIASILFLLHNVGYTPTEMKNIIVNTNFKSLKNVKFSNLKEMYGLDDAKMIIKWLNDLVVTKLGHEYDRITFIELYNITKKKLTIVGTDLSTHTSVYYNHINTPHISILDAVRISMGFPLIFTRVKYNDHIYADGGILDNFSIHLFKDKPLDTVLGLKIGRDQEHVENPVFDMPDLESYLANLINCMFYDIERIKTIPEMIPRTVSIPTSGFPVIDYNMSNDDKLRLVNIGYEAAKKWYADIESNKTSD